MTEIDARRPPLDQALALYDSVGWTAYTRDPELLDRALDDSYTVLSARDGGLLVGAVRIVSDGATIAYLQDVLVAPSHQRRGVGSQLVRAALSRTAHIRQSVLLTDDEPGQRAFYESLGFTEAHRMNAQVTRILLPVVAGLLAIGGARNGIVLTRAVCDGSVGTATLLGCSGRLCSSKRCSSANPPSLRGTGSTPSHPLVTPPGHE